MYLFHHIFQICGISLAAASIAHGFVAARFPREVSLPAPTLDQLRVFSPSSITIKWSPVKSNNEPILGYKVRLWKQEDKKTVFILKTVDGEEAVVEQIEKPKITDLSARNGKPLEYRISGAEHSELTLHGLKMDTPYLIEILAFSANRDGPPSLANVIEIHSQSNVNNKAKINTDSGFIGAIDFKPNVKYDLTLH